MQLESLQFDVVTGKPTKLAQAARKALRALLRADVPFAVIGAAALGARGLPRFTADLDIVVLRDEAWDALDALRDAGFRSETPLRRDDDPEPMYVLRSRDGIDVDVLVAAGEPESTVVAEAPSARLFATEAPTATLEHLLLMYLYSNRPKHLGDFERIVTEGKPDLAWIERYLADVHAEMLATFRARVHQARHPRPAPKRPTKKRSPRRR